MTTDCKSLLSADRETLARVCWPRLLDKAPLTLDERRVIGGLWQIVVSEDDEITRKARERCLLDALGQGRFPAFSLVLTSAVLPATGRESVANSPQAKPR